MKRETQIIPLFQQFIKESANGKRLKKNGGRISKGTIKNYRNCLRILEVFSTTSSFELRICDASKLNSREWITEKNYWKKFYRKFTGYLYKNGCHDNYVGSLVKTFRTFLSYIKHERNYHTGDIHRLFYVRKENIEILVLSPVELKFLIHDREFEDSLGKRLIEIKDFFVFGCTTGLRFSDLFQLTNKNFDKQESLWYLKIKSQKTKTFSYIKLPPYAAKIYLNYRPTSNKLPVFGKMTLTKFNKGLKSLGLKAGFTKTVDSSREVLGRMRNKSKQHHFYEKMSSHMMRRTAITTMLIFGMPEHLVRKISGHSNSSKDFNRYIHYAQPYVDREIDKLHSKLNSYSNAY